MNQRNTASCTIDLGERNMTQEIFQGNKTDTNEIKLNLNIYSSSTNELCGDNYSSSTMNNLLSQSLALYEIDEKSLVQINES